MASTRMKNSRCDYNLETIQNRSIVDNRVAKIRSYAAANALPCAGINVGYMPRETLSYNPTETESYLYGVNSTNLTQKKREFTPRIKTLKSLSFFDRLQAYLPEPLVIEKDQRPFIPGF